MVSNGNECPDSVPLDDDSGSLARRVRPLIGLTLVGWSTYVIVGVIARNWLAVAVNAVGMVGAGAVYLMLPARPSLARPAAHGLSGVAVACVIASTMISGQTWSPSLWYLAGVPVAVGYLLGRRPATVWAGVCVIAAVAIEAVRRLYPIAPTVHVGPEILLVSLIVLIVLVSALVNTATRLNEQQVRALEQREVTIRELYTGLEKQKEELLRARDEAIAASRAKSEFVATVSHEIRTPLNGVLGMANILLDEHLSPRQRELVRTIRLSGDALLGIINDILDFSKIEAEKLELECAPFDLREHVEDAVELFSAAAAKKGLELTATIEEHTPARVLGDGARVRQILVNLLGNATKFTERGEIAVTLSTRPAEPISGANGPPSTARHSHSGEPRQPPGSGDDAIEIHCSVRDTGIGIPAERLPSLFAPFSQVDPSMTRRFGGTGLGLAISQRLAQAMGGTMSVKSVAGAGSTFTFTFRTEPQPPPIPTMREHSGKHCGVMCARASTRTMIESLARSLSFVPVSWESADAMCSSGIECDVLVIEVALYDERVRRATSAVGVPVVLLTSPAVVSTQHTALGVANTLAKPVRRSDLRRGLLQALGSSIGDSAPTASRLPAIAPEIPLRVLVVEDNPINQRVALLLLERMGYRADVAGNGVEAIEAITTRPYDLVLMDVRMPDMDGITATTRIRETVPRERQPRVVAMTANATVEDRDACRRAGMDDFMSKPIRAADLVRVLRATKGRGASPVEDAIDHVALGALRRLLADKPGELRAMMGDYFDSAERLLADIDAALSRGDKEAAEMAAHSFKGVSGQMGARHVMAAAFRVEKLAASGDLASARSFVSVLRAAHEASRPLLLEATEERAPPSRQQLASAP